MARIFISYSRVDKPSAERLVGHLRRVYEYPNVWYDDNLHGGDKWWKEILTQIAACDIFIYLLSNESVESPYCQAEFQEALRLRKRIITVQVRDRTRIPSELDDIHYVDMGSGVDNADALTQLYGSIQRQMEISQKEGRKKPLSNIPTPRPRIPSQNEDIIDPAADRSTLTLRIPKQPPEKPKRFLLTEPWAIIIGALITGAAAIIAAFVALGGDDNGNVTPTALSAEDIAETLIAERATQTATRWTPTPSDTPSITPTFTETPNTLATENANQTATAAQWTATPTATNTPSETPTSTLTATSTPSDTPTSTSTATSTPSETPTLTPTLDITATTEAIWFPNDKGRSLDNPVTSNDQWEKVSQEFNGIEMVLVPAGCFMMGSNNGDADEQPVHQQCFEKPFWIDLTEVTNEQYGSVGHWSGDDRPREMISWIAASLYCRSRDGRLPSEVEWEYAARGPDNLKYPWGNTFVPANVVYNGNSGETTVVGSRLAGASWVGSLDMSGNVWEWTSTIYKDYPYDANDLRENLNDPDRRVFRGNGFSTPSTLIATSDRNFANRDMKFSYLGFRCARDY